MTNGVLFSVARATPFHDDPMRLWRNDSGVFTEISASEGIVDMGSGKGILVLDYDLDGDLDVFVVNNAGHPKLYRNDVKNPNAFLRVNRIIVGDLACFGILINRLLRPCHPAHASQATNPQAHWACRHGRSR